MQTPGDSEAQEDPDLIYIIHTQGLCVKVVQCKVTKCNITGGEGGGHSLGLHTGYSATGED